MMNRLSLINALINASNYNTYLEIGCYKGRTFFEVKAKTKIAVDPAFHWTFYKHLISNYFKNHKLLIFKKPSDVFFSRKKSVLKKQTPLDIALIDGLHTFHASLKDVFNTLRYLQEKGTIILHDCNPPNAGAAMPTINFPTKTEQMACSDWTGAWCGDVWKTVVYLKKHHAEALDVKVVNTDSGLGIVTLKPGAKEQAFAIDDANFKAIDAMGYEDLVNNKGVLLSLTTVSDFKVQLKERFSKIKF